MAKNNATCLNCGKGYYICRSCESIYSWRQVACCPECFRALEEKRAKAQKKAVASVENKAPTVAKSKTKKTSAKK